MTNMDKIKKQRSSIPGFVPRLFAPLAWAATIFWLSLTSSPPQIPGPLGWDKLLHTGAYGLLTLLIAQFLLCLPLNPRKICQVASLAAICFGATMEVLQFLAGTGRTAEWWDLFADVAGVFLACVLFRQVADRVWSRHEPLDKDNG